MKVVLFEHFFLFRFFEQYRDISRQLAKVEEFLHLEYPITIRQTDLVRRFENWAKAKMVSYLIRRLKPTAIKRMNCSSIAVQLPFLLRNGLKITR
jgi:hypothetical protein